VIFSFLQVFLEPSANVVLSAWLSHLTISAYLHALLNSRHWVGLFYLLALPVIMGGAVYAVKKWSYSIFVASATWMLIRNFMTYRSQANHVNVAFAVTFYLLNIGFVGYFLIPAVRRQYFDARVRWWETANRYLVNFGARFEHGEKNDVGEIRDISVGGVFAYLPEKIAKDETIRLRFTPNGRHIFSIKARVVFHRQSTPIERSATLERPSAETRFGHGLQFIEVTPATQQMLKELAKELRASGCPSRDLAGSHWEDFKKWSVQLLTTGQGLFPSYPNLPALGAKTASEVVAVMDEDQAA
jgi:hypothetical protein